jgi:hypothetical protein
LNAAALSRIQPDRLELSPSLPFASVILAVHAMGAGCFLTFLTDWRGGCLAGAVFALGCAAAWDRALLRSRRSPRAIELPAVGEARCRFADGSAAVLVPLGGSAVTRYWVALGLRSPGRRSLFVAAGMLAPEALRRLRLWALWGKLPAVAPRQQNAGRR